MNYAKLTVKLKKAFPEITDEELNEIISQTPSNLPDFMIDSLIGLTKMCKKDPSKLDDLQKLNVLDQIPPQVQRKMHRGLKNKFLEKGKESNEFNCTK